MKYRTAIAVLAIGFLLFINGEGVMAQTTDPWVTPSLHPQVLRQLPVAHDHRQYCNGEEMTIEIRGVHRQACTQGGGPTIARYYDDRGYLQTAIKLTILPHYLPIESICGNWQECLYSSENDLLITKQYGNNWQYQLIFYENFSQKLEFHLLPTPHFTVNQAQPDRIATAANGEIISVGAVSLSVNGQYVVMELVNSGVALLNTKTWEFRRILALGERYGYGLDPRFELAVAEDGQTVVITGRNVGFYIVSVTDKCGENVEGPPGRYMSPSTLPCHYSDASLPEAVERYRFTAAPKFHGDGIFLTVHVLTSTGDNRLVSLGPSGTTWSSSTDYVSLGDSYTSGEGETDSTRYRSLTDENQDACHISTRSYPYRIALAQRWQHIGVACSGARIHDLAGQGKYDGQGGRMRGDVGPRLQSDAFFQNIPGRIRQIEFLNRYQPDHATISVGGNDAGIIDKLKACAGPGECHWASQTMRRSVAREIDRLSTHYGALFERAKAASPRTKIYAVGYPLAISLLGGRCDVATGFLFTESERALLYWSIHRLNNVMRQSAMATGSAFIDVSDAYEGHELCQQTNTPAMNGIRFKNGRVASESYHPTPYGHELVAAKVERAMMTSSFPCTRTCSEAGDTYWLQPEDDEEYELFTTPLIPTTCFSVCEIVVPPLTFASESSVRIEVRSEAQFIGKYHVNSDGSLQQNVAFPKDLNGYHTLHVSGTAVNGQTINLYQVILFPLAEQLKDGPIGSTTIAVSPGITSATSSLAVRDDSVRSELLPVKPDVDSQRSNEAAGAENIKLDWTPLVFIPTGIISVWLIYVLWLRNLFQQRFLRR